VGTAVGRSIRRLAFVLGRLALVRRLVEFVSLVE
jgi:hypothetical protein